jgi:hypothetical protein
VWAKPVPLADCLANRYLIDSADTGFFPSPNCAIPFECFRLSLQSAILSFHFRRTIQSTARRIAAIVYTCPPTAQSVSLVCIGRRCMMASIASQANANLKADTTDELLGRKRSMHMTAFRYRIDEISEILEAPFSLALCPICLDSALIKFIGTWRVSGKAFRCKLGGTDICLAFEHIFPCYL